MPFDFTLGLGGEDGFRETPYDALLCAINFALSDEELSLDESVKAIAVAVGHYNRQEHKNFHADTRSLVQKAIYGVAGSLGCAEDDVKNLVELLPPALEELGYDPKPLAPPAPS